MSVSRFYQCLVGAAIWLALAAPVSAATVTLAWDLNPTGDGVFNYNVFVSAQPGTWGNGLAVGNRTTWTFTGLQANYPYYFGVQAQSATGWSLVSQIAYTTPGTNPPGGERSRSDFNGNGKFDVLWEHKTTGQLAFWELNGTAVVDSGWLAPASVAPIWKMSGSADLNRDGKPDLVWHNQTTGEVLFWLMDGTNNYSVGFVSTPVVPSWSIVSIRDFDLDGNPDLWWMNQTTGDMAIWYLNGTGIRNMGTPNPAKMTDTNWKLAATADFTGDGKADALWHNTTTGELVVWGLNGTYQTSAYHLNPAFVAANWKVAAVGDANGDGRADIVWRNDLSGGVVLWEMQGLNLIRSGYLSTPGADINWNIMAPR